jgi:hypothetical protein
MPVRINLKELFGSDSQEISIDKLNFNFNKLLELGIGLKGATGISGVQGAIGPSGPVGLKGDKGNQWFVGSGNPNTQTFTDLMDEDFFANSDNSQIWQYDLSSDTWNIIIDLEGIVNTYLTTSGSTFVRGYGDISPSDSRYIMFPNRGNTISDVTGDQFATAGSNNDVLLLNNFNENENHVTISSIIDTDNEYTALQKTFVDFTSTIFGRYHAEYGSLYTIDGGTTNYISDTHNNLKVRHNAIEGITGDIFYKGIFSMAKHETEPNTVADANGILEFQLSKYSASDMVQDVSTIQIGSKYGLQEIASYVKFDGINFKTSTLNAGIGIVDGFEHVLNDINGNGYLLLDTDGSDKYIGLGRTTHQDGGNIRQLGTSPFRDLGVNAAGRTTHASGSDSFDQRGSAILGNTLYIIEGTSHTIGQALMGPTDKGYISRWDIRDKGDIKEIQIDKFTEHDYSGTTRINGVGFADIDVSGDYIYIVNNNNVNTWINSTIFANSYRKTYFQIGRLQDSNESIEYVGGITDNDPLYTNLIDINSAWLTGAYRVKVSGHYAFVSTNNLKNFGGTDTLSSDTTWGGTEDYQKGWISAIDISDPTNPGAVDYISRENAHYLDMDVSEDFVAMIALTVGTGTGIGWQGHKVEVVTYDIDHNANVKGDNVSTSTELVLSSGNTSSPIYEDGFNSGGTLLTIGNSQDHSVINKFGSISIDGRNVYAMYKNSLYVYTKYTEGTNASSSLNLMYSLDFNDGITTTRALDSKVVGNSLYVLINEGGTLSYEPTGDNYLVKISIDSRSGAQVIRKQSIGNGYYSTMEVSGGNIYVSGTTLSGTPEVKTIEVDRFESDHANISNIKSSDINVTNDLLVGGDAKVKYGLNVGARGILSHGGIVTHGGMSNSAKRWYYGSGITTNTPDGSGISGGFYLNLSEGQSLSKGLDADYVYKVILRIGNTVYTDMDATYVVVRDSSLTWEVRLVSGKVAAYSPGSPLPALSVEYDGTGAGEDKLIAYTDDPLINYKIQYTVESTYTGLNELAGEPSIHSMGADGMWQRVGSALIYEDGHVNVNGSTPSAPGLLNVYNSEFFGPAIKIINSYDNSEVFRFGIFNPANGNHSGVTNLVESTISSTESITLVSDEKIIIKSPNGLHLSNANGTSTAEIKSSSGAVSTNIILPPTQGNAGDILTTTNAGTGQTGWQAPAADGDYVPCGAIIMWSGAVAAIPTGYVLCDGSNGTPDLRERFIVGAGGINGTHATPNPTTYGVGDWGGQKNMPEHNHSASTSVVYGDVRQGEKAVGSNTAGGEQAGNITDLIISATTTIENTGTGPLANDNRPPFLALAFIMRDCGGVAFDPGVLVPSEDGLPAG